MSEIVTSFTDWESGLAHHGVKGQKWGVRNYQNADGSLTAAGRAHYGVAEGGSKRMSRQYNRAVRKLNKLEKRTNISLQKENAEKYNKRAKTGLKVAGVGALIAGAGAAAEYGGAGLRSQLVSQALKASKNREWAARDANSEQYFKDWIHWDNQRQTLTGNEIGDWNKIYDRNQDRAFDTFQKNEQSIRSAAVSERKGINAKAGLASQIHKGVMIAGAATAAVGAGVAAYNKVQAHLATKRTTEAGHQKAVAKYKAQYEKMTKQFANTPYSALLKNKKS